jgi:uncharacterized protein involved in exopolysaccharide biosynthesis/Mrp family chromosome partitioning ATPase
MSDLTRWPGADPHYPAASASDMHVRPMFGEPDFSAIIRSLISNFHIIAAVTLIGATISYAALKAMTPQFTASTMIMLDSRSTILDDASNVFTTLPIADAYIESEIELIRSDAIVRRVIGELNLMTDPEFTAGEIPQGILLLAKERATAEGEELITSVKTLQVANALRKRLAVKRRGLSQGIVISFRSRSQVKARDIANAFADAYVGDQLQNKLQSSERAMQWLRSELDLMANETRASERAVEAYREQNTLVGEGEQGLSSQQMRLLTADLAEAKVAESQLRVTIDRLNTLNNDRATLLSTPEIAEKAPVRALRADLAEAERTVSEFEGRYNVENMERIPPYQEALARRRAIETQLDKEAAAAIDELRAQYAAATNLVSSLERELDALRAQNAAVNTASVGLNELEREAEAKRRRYEALLAEFNEADNIAAVQLPHARIVSPAELPLAPSAPRKKAAFGAAVLLSFALGVFMALLRENFRRSIRTEDELQQAAKMRMVGATPRLKSRDRDIASAMNAIVREPYGGFSKSIRSLREELALEGRFGVCKVIAVTTPQKDEGKGAVAAGLARSMALAKISTLLIDANLQRPQIMPQLYRELDGADFGDVFSAKAAWRDVIVRGNKPPLDILGARRAVWNERVFEFFEQRFERMLAEWRNECQAIIINAPPTLRSPKARAIARHCDDVLLCVHWNETPRREVQSSIELLGGATGEAPKPVLINVAEGSFRRIERRRLRPFAAFRSPYAIVGGL